MNCPKCGGDMSPMGLSDGVQVDFCSGCSGILFDAGEVAETLQLGQDIPSLRNLNTARPTGAMCPKCSKPWVEIPYQPGQPLLVDLCTGCGAIYLDKGEFPKLRQIAVTLEQPKSRILRAVKSMQEKGYEVLGATKK